MKTTAYLLLLVAAVSGGVLLPYTPGWAYLPDVVLLTQIDPLNRYTVQTAYQTVYDLQSRPIKFNAYDTLAWMAGPATQRWTAETVFQPDLKLVYRTHTLVFSLGTHQVYRYRNSSPYLASKVLEPLGFRFDEELSRYVRKLAHVYFPTAPVAHFTVKQLQNVRLFIPAPKTDTDTQKSTESLTPVALENRLLDLHTAYQREMVFNPSAVTLPMPKRPVPPRVKLSFSERFEAVPWVVSSWFRKGSVDSPATVPDNLPCPHNAPAHRLDTDDWLCEN
jgi:hypothetical protein